MLVVWSVTIHGMPLSRLAPGGLRPCLGGEALASWGGAAAAGAVEATGLGDGDRFSLRRAERTALGEGVSELDLGRGDAGRGALMDGTIDRIEADDFGRRIEGAPDWTELVLIVSFRPAFSSVLAADAAVGFANEAFSLPLDVLPPTLGELSTPPAAPAFGSGGGLPGPAPLGPTGRARLVADDGALGREGARLRGVDGPGVEEDGVDGVRVLSIEVTDEGRLETADGCLADSGVAGVARAAGLG